MTDTRNAPRLIANLGAEEGRSGREAAARVGGEAALLAELWRGLFEPPVFPWLDGIEVAAWLNDADAEREAGTRVLSGASAAVVRRVHDKAWAVSVARAERLEPPVLRGVPTSLAPEELRAPGAAAHVADVLAGWPAWARARFTLKPRFGTSGRGRVAGVDGVVSDAMQGAFERLASRGGAVLEPWLDRLADASAQLHIARDGVVTLLGTLQIVTTGSGQPRGHRGECDARGQARSGIGEDDALREAAQVVGARAAGDGYHGPCSIDAFAFRSPVDGSRGFRPLVEFNARFTAGTVALGHVARNLDRAKTTLGLSSGETCHFYIGSGVGGGPAAPGAGATVLSLLAEPHDRADAPVLVAARERESVDGWLGPTAQ
ncbi:MAG: hypothetical protein O2930_16235 [Acidobacteria bacterium]|nr:hypothetical protein [Acidobacteriota bacterium]